MNNSATVNQRPATSDQPITVHLNFRTFIRSGTGKFNAIGGGIDAYEKEITSRLAKYDDLKLDPFYFSVKSPQQSESDFNLRKVKFPGFLTWRSSSKGIKRVIKCMLTFMFNLVKPFLSLDSVIGGNENDTYVFFFHLPVLNIKGKSIAIIYDLNPLRLKLDDSDKKIGHLHKYFRRTFIEELQDIIKRASKIVTISEFTRRDFADYFHIDENRIEIVYCGINPSVYSREYDLNFIREKYNLHGKYVLYFGSCHMRKNVETLIRAYSKLPESLRREYKLVITNPIGDTKECVNDCGISDYVHYIEAIPEDEKPVIYKLASVSVYPSLYEGFGIPILEAMASGVPVICSNATSMPEVAGDAAILVDPLDDVNMSREIGRVLNDENLRREMIAKGYENIKRFSWDESARKLHDIIINLR